jgi:hypothetical protein
LTKPLPLVLLALASVAALILLSSGDEPHFVPRTVALAPLVADATLAEPAPAKGISVSLGDPSVLQAPNPAAVPDRPRRWERRLVDQFVRDMERSGPDGAAEPEPRVVPEEAKAEFAAGFRAAIAEHERTEP